MVTPGEVRTIDVNQVCGFLTADVRHTTESVKNEVYAEYGVTKNKGICIKGCEIDHLIPLELGGADTLTNLWPQPAPQYKQKDKLENYLNRKVCSGEMALLDAQAMIRTGWHAAYLGMDVGQVGD